MAAPAAPGAANARPGSDEYPRQAARTRNFSLGVPRSFTVAPDGSRVAFLRTRAGDDPVSCLWVLDVGTGAERLVFDPRSHAHEEDVSALSPAERARRERVREQAGGVVAYATDREVRRAVFGLGGRLFLADLADGEVSRGEGAPSRPCRGLSASHSRSGPGRSGERSSLPWSRSS